MPRKIQPGEQLVIASHNSGKIEEIGALLEPYRVEAVGADTLGLPEPEETETTFEGNAALKAHAASPHMAAYGAKTKELIASRVIHILTPV